MYQQRLYKYAAKTATIGSPNPTPPAVHHHHQRGYVAPTVSLALVGAALSDLHVLLAACPLCWTLISVVFAVVVTSFQLIVATEVYYS